MMSAEDLAAKFVSKMPETDRTAAANALYEEAADNAVGYTAAEDWLGDYKDSVKKYLVPSDSPFTSMSRSDQIKRDMNLSDEDLNTLGSYIASKVITDRNS